MEGRDESRALILAWPRGEKEDMGFVVAKKYSSTEVQPLGWSTQAPATGELGRMAHRLDVPVQEAHGVNGFDGLQDLLAQPQCSA